MEQKNEGVHTKREPLQLERQGVVMQTYSGSIQPAGKRVGLPEHLGELIHGDLAALLHLVELLIHHLHDIRLRKHAVFIGHFHVGCLVERRQWVAICLRLSCKGRSQGNRGTKHSESAIKFIHSQLSFKGKNTDQQMIALIGDA